MISWSGIAVVIKSAALAATHRIEPSGLGDKRVTLAPEITTFKPRSTATPNHVQKTRGLDPKR
jgi:hypothetical protein